jgi:hypothetical protein
MSFLGCPSGPAIGLSDTSHDFGASETEWSFQVWNTGAAGTTLDFTVTADQPAVQCDVTGGTSTDSADARTIHVTLDRAELPAGDSQLSVTIGGAGLASKKVQLHAVRPAGSLTATVEPMGARNAGAQWRVDGGAWRNSGATVTKLLPGSHVVSYKEVAGWTKPEDQNVNVAADQTTSAIGTYVQAGVVTGWLRVAIEPAAARDSGAQWNVDGGAWHASGETVSGVAPGQHTVSFKAITGWNKAADATVSIVANETTDASGTYTAQTAGLHVIIEPEAARLAGAQWRVDGGAWLNSGDTAADLTAGQHVLSFSDIVGWTKPNSRTISVAGNQTTEATGTYTQLNTSMVVMGYNDLGMHCMNEDFSEMMILPPFNTLHATIVDRSGGEPHIVKTGVVVEYTIPGNTHSSDKTNFWDYVNPLLGVNLANDIGLTGNGLSGSMVSLAAQGRNDWNVTGIPITPIDDSGKENPYSLATITVKKNGQKVAETQAVVPVSWEISCDICHNTPGISAATDILRAHDRLHPGLNLESKKPVLCSQCHAQAPLGTTGTPGTPALSRAMHHAHSTRMEQAGLNVACYACHPGVRTQCLRDVHYANGMVCMDCHGTMSDVADPTRRPWQDEPRCDSCHSRSGFQFEQPGTLYRNSKGHMGIHCAACHGSPHAITPTVTPADNLQALALQGHAGTIDKCAVCHRETPDDAFPHRVSDDK